MYEFGGGSAWQLYAVGHLMEYFIPLPPGQTGTDEKRVQTTEIQNVLNRQA